MNAGQNQHTLELIRRASRTRGGHLEIGHGGFSLHYDRGCKLSGYDCEPMKRTCVACGLPVIDSRDVPFEDVWKLAVGGPMIAIGHDADPAPWGPLAYAPLHAVADAYRAAGAEILNIPTETGSDGS